MNKKLLIISFLLILLWGCDFQKQYYNSHNIYMQQCFKKDKKVFFEYTPILESIYTSSGVDVEYSIDSTIVKLFFITQNSKMLQHKVDIKSILVKNKDSLRVWQIELPEKVNKIIVSPPDSVFVQNIKPFSKLNN